MDRDHDIGVLNSLISTTIDSAHGYELSAEDADASRYTQLFRTFADERRRVVAQLQETVSSLGGEPTDDGSLIAGLHRRWLDLRDALLGGDEAIILEVERGEDHLKAGYDDALADSGLSSGTQGVIRKAYQSVVAGHNQARQLKQSLQDTPA